VRSRPDVEVHQLSLARVGQPARIRVTLDSRSETPTEGVTVVYTIVECYRVRTDDGTSETRDVVYSQDKRLNIERLGPGRVEHELDFDVPLDAPPSCEGTHSSVEHLLEVHVAIPWWPDRRKSFLLNVLPVTWSIQPEPARLFHAQHGNGTRIEGSVDTPILRPGDVVSGRFSLLNFGAAHAREASVTLCAIETARNQMLEGSRFILPMAHLPGEGETVSFTARVPSTIACSYRGRKTGLEWIVRIEVKFGWREVMALSIPVRVVHADVALPGQPAQVVVGNERRALVWNEVAQQLGLTHDPVHHQLLRQGQRLSVSIRLVPDAEIGYRLTGKLTWPRLGLDLNVGERTLADIFRAREVDVGDFDFTERFHVYGHEPRQVRALLDRSVRDSLRQDFAVVRLDDEGADVQSAGADSPGALMAFATKVYQLAGAVDAALERLPARRPFLPHVDAWRAEASRLSGRFEPGRVRILDGRLGNDRIEIATIWDGDTVVGTRVRVPLLPPLTSAEKLPARAEPLIRDIEANCDELVLTAEQIEVDMSLALLDPGALQPQLDRLSRLTLALRGLGTEGPYR
jgi:hypothetical protein